MRLPILKPHTLALAVLVLASLWVAPGPVGGVPGVAEDQGNPDDQLAQVSRTIEGNLEGGYAQLTDYREVYNRGEGPTVVQYLFAVPANATLTHQEVATDTTVYTLLPTPGPRDMAAILAEPGVAYAYYLDPGQARDLLADQVQSHSEASFLSLMGHSLLGLEFALPAETFVGVTVNYTQPLDRQGGLTTLNLALAPALLTADGGGLAAETPGGGRLDLQINSVYTLEGFYSPTHAVTVTPAGLHSATLEWEGGAAPGEVLTLHYSELTDPFGAGLLNYRLPAKTMFQLDEDGYFMFLFTPNTQEFATQTLAKDLVFVVDTSASMAGTKLDQTRLALKEILARLGPQDRFTIIEFNTRTTAFSRELYPAQPQALSLAHDFLDNLTASGATDIHGALTEALTIVSQHPAEGRPRQIILLTDGAPTAGVIDNEALLEGVREANAAGEANATPATLYAFGLGSGVNTYLLDRLASDSNGAAHYLADDERLAEALLSIYGSIAAPVLTNLTLQVSGVEVLEVYPHQLSNLYRGGQIDLVAAYAFPQEAVVDENGSLTLQPLIPDRITLYLNGTTASGPLNYVLPFAMEEPGRHSYLPHIYATRAVAELLQQIKQQGETEELVAQVRYLGLRYGLQTPYTDLLLQTNPLFDSDGFRTLTGENSIQASQIIHSYGRSKLAGVGLTANTRLVGDRAFVNLEGLYVESALLPQSAVLDLEGATVEDWLLETLDLDRVVKFASPQYFDLAEQADLREVLALGTEVIFAHGQTLTAVTTGNLLLPLRNLQTAMWDLNVSFTWQTPTPATSAVHYRLAQGGTYSEWFTLKNLTLTTDHNLTTLLPHGLYQFYVESADGQGNTAVRDNDGEFYTLKHSSLVILMVQANVGGAIFAGQSVTVRWYTNVPAYGNLLLDTGNGFDSYGADTGFGTEHSSTFEAYPSNYIGNTKWRFYVTATADENTIVEDNHGQYFTLAVIHLSMTTPSFQMNFFSLALAALFSATLAARLRQDHQDRKEG